MGEWDLKEVLHLPVVLYVLCGGKFLTFSCDVIQGERVEKKAKGTPAQLSQNEGTTTVRVAPQHIAISPGMYFFLD